MQSVQKYSIDVLMGNWVEEKCLYDEKIGLFLEKRNRNDKQKKRELYASLLSPVSLEAIGEFVTYGQYMRIVCPALRFPGSKEFGVSMSCSVSEQHVSELDGLNPGCPITASPFTEPCVRNCFKIIRFGCKTEDGQPLKFGDTVIISTCSPFQPLFVAASMPRLLSERGLSNHPALKLAESADACCRWTVDYWNADLRPEAEGLPIPNDTQFVLKHNATNQNAAVETAAFLPTFAGYEYEISAHSYKHSNGRDMAQNVWKFVTCRKPVVVDDDRKK